MVICISEVGGFDMFDKLKLAKINEAYHRKQMEYFLEEIKILEESEPKPKRRKTTSRVIKRKKFTNIYKHEQKKTN